jgi:hypothetical protein
MAILRPQQMQICTDYDMITLRQAVRQTSRAVGLGPAQQARMTAAISEVARALLTERGGGFFTIRLDMRASACPALEVACEAHPGDDDATNQLYQSAAVAEARALVDEAQVEFADPGPQLLMRMWIGR